MVVHHQLSNKAIINITIILNHYVFTALVSMLVINK